MSDTRATATENDAEKKAANLSTDGSYRRIVVKIGSSTLTDDAGSINRDFIRALGDQVNTIRQTLGSQVLIVTSGAIAAGLEALGYGGVRPTDMPSLQAAAAVGQLRLSQVYSEEFAAWQMKLGQVLLTRFDTENRSSYLHARDTMERLLELGVVPLINENDTVAVDEIRFGDNDTLAAHVAVLVKADLVILLSDIDGLYSADPRRHEDAVLIDSIGALTKEIVQAAGAAGTVRGSGGMVTKLEAARICMAAGIQMVICEGERPNVVLDVARGESLGTRFAAESNHSYSARKLWMALSGQVLGSLYVDSGAEQALREKGRSLLPVGISKVEGEFAAGAAVDIRAQDGMIIGRGLTNYDSATLTESAGRSFSQLTGSTDLPEASSAAQVAIHRDQLVIFY
ncbi:MAG: glutamate 5-kinase [Coriobacteriia bacterium]|nr:glutamate 5-kinase [Coriobacteriia bacterium]